jgi:aarF domain-containing kinase
MHPPGIIAFCRALVAAVKWAFPQHDFMWLVEETERNLPLELDFEHEAANAARCRANFASHRCVLTVLWQPGLWMSAHARS